MASIYKLSNGRWIAQIRLTGSPSRSKTFETHQKAVNWARATEGQAPPRESKRGTPQPRFKVYHLLNRFEKEIIPTYRSKKTAAGIVKALRSEFGEIYLNDLASSRIASYRDKRIHAGISGSTVIRELGLLSKAIELARKDWEMLNKENPVRRISKPKPGKARSRRPSTEEINSLLQECERRNLRPMSYAIELAIETGMRLGELLSIEIDSLHLDQSTLHLPMTKNGDSRDVPLSQRAKELILALKQDRNEGRLFLNWSTTDGFKATFRRVLEKTGITDLRFHDLRREATSRFFEKGLNPVQVAAITGHKTLQMLQRYTHLKANDLAKLL